MTKLLEDAIAQARELPEEEQDAMADVLFTYMTGAGVRCGLSDEQVAEVMRIRDKLRTGKTRLVPDNEMDAFWQTYSE